MEKVLIIPSTSYFHRSDIEPEINQYLESGWTVKDLKMSTDGDIFVFAVVLKKDGKE